MDNKWYLHDPHGEENNAAHIQDEGAGDAVNSAHTEPEAEARGGESRQDGSLPEYNNNEEGDLDFNRSLVDGFSQSENSAAQNEQGAEEGAAAHCAPYEVVPIPVKNAKDAKEAKSAKKRKSTVRFSTFVACLLIMVVLGGVLGGGVVHLMQADQPSTTPGQVEGNEGGGEGSNEGDGGAQPPDTNKPSSGLNLSTGQSAPVTNREEAVAKAISSIVSINVAAAPDMLGETKTGSGSGVIVTADGYIVTNNHVVNGATSIKVYLQDGSEHDAKLIGTDTQSDLAVIKIEAENLPAATIGESSTLRVGQEVVAIGNPLGQLMSTVTNGIISALDRTITVEGQEMTLLQTNAAINPGNSGGGLFDMNGNLVGVVNAKSMGFEVEGLGFAIPIDVAKTVVADLIDQGYVSGRPYLGVSVQDVTYAHGDQNDYNNPFLSGQQYTTRVQVMSIEDGGPAAKGGMQLNDLILKVNETDVTGSSQFISLLSEYNAGDVVTITVQRGNNTVELSIALGERTA